MGFPRNQGVLSCRGNGEWNCEVTLATHLSPTTPSSSNSRAASVQSWPHYNLIFSGCPELGLTARSPDLA